MNLSTEIVKHTFGFDATALRSSWYSADLLASEKSKQHQRHLDALKVFIGDIRCIGSTSGYGEERDDSGLEASWWTVVIFDLDRGGDSV